MAKSVELDGVCRLFKKLSPEEKELFIDYLGIMQANLMHKNPELQAANPQSWEEVKHLVGRPHVYDQYAQKAA